MRTNVNNVKDWIEELKKRGISEFQFKDLPDDLKKIGLIRKAKVLDKIKMKKKIKSIIVWKLE